MEPVTDNLLNPECKEEGTSAPSPLPAPVPAPADRITKAIRNNARHRMSPKKPVAIQKCEICNIELIGQVVIDAHMNGSKHAKKLKSKQLLSNLIGTGQVNTQVNTQVNAQASDKSAMFKCEPCNVVLNSTQQWEVHNAGAKHKAMVDKDGHDQVKVNDGVQGNEPRNETSEDSAQVAPSAVAFSEKPKHVIANPLDLVCNVCNITVNSPQQLEQHLQSKKHQDREAGRKPQRSGPYTRAGRGGRGGLGSQGHGGKAVSAKFSSLSSSFKSAGYSNSFIKPEGGVIMPQNCGANRSSNQSVPSQQPANKGPNFGGQFKNRGNFGSLTPYINADNSSGRGGFNSRGGAARGSWGGPNNSYGPSAGYSGYNYEQYGYNYSGDYSGDYSGNYSGHYSANYPGYDNTDGYGGYGMVPSEAQPQARAGPVGMVGEVRPGPPSGPYW